VKATYANNRTSNAADKYYKSLAYKVEKTTGSYDKSRAERARKKGYEGMAAKYEESYKKAAGVKVRNAAKATISKGQKALSNLFKSKTTVTVTSNLMPAGTKKTIKKN
jgi:hypothetical protein